MFNFSDMQITGMLLKSCFSFLLAILFFSSCSHIYEPAQYHRNIVYQSKPSSFDTVKSANYVSVAYNASSNINGNDFQESGQVNLSRGYIFNHANLAFGLFGVLGDYENSAINPGDANYFTGKFFGAVGGRASANLFSTSISERSEYRYLGIEAAYSHEFGAYARFRQYLNNQPGYYVDSRTDLFTIGLTTEILIRSESKKIQQSFRLFFGTDAGYNKLNETYYNNKKVPTNTFPQLFNLGFMDFYPKASYYIKFKDYFATIETGGLFLRLGYKF